MNPPVLLHVEDNLDDRILFGQAQLLAGASFRLYPVEHGQAAVDYLKAASSGADSAKFPMPDTVLLDLKMPVLDGFGVLHWIRAQRALQGLPVLVFTSSYQHSDIERGYAEGATAFFTKPSDFEGLLRLVRALDESLASGEREFNPLKTLPEYKHASVEQRSTQDE